MLNIQSHLCRMGKIANNLEKAGKDGGHVTGFTIPISEFRLTPEQFDVFVDRKYASRGLHDVRDGKAVPALDFIEPYVVTHEFENATLVLVMSEGRGKSIERAKCKVKNITFWPLQGAADSGMIELAFSVYLHPEIGTDNLTLQENQDTEIHLTIQDAAIASKAKDKQQDLFPNGAQANKGEGFAASAAAMASKTAAETNEAAANAQVQAFNNGTEVACICREYIGDALKIEETCTAKQHGPPTPSPAEIAKDTAEFADAAKGKVAEFRGRRNATPETH